MSEFPSRQHQFRPGEPSANPAGRPKGRSITAILRELLDREEDDGRTVAEVIAETLIRQAKTCDPKLVRILFERAYGKVPDVIEGNPDRPLKIVVEYVDEGIASGDDGSG